MDTTKNIEQGLRRLARDGWTDAAKNRRPAGHFSTGDRVEPKHADADSHDVGYIVGWEPGGLAVVSWDRAGETYTEQTGDLVHARGEGS